MRKISLQNKKKHNSIHKEQIITNDSWSSKMLCYNQYVKFGL